MAARPGLIAALLMAIALTPGMAAEQGPGPTRADLAATAARRFPQPVRASDLLDRTVLQPLESQPVLGRVVQVVRTADGAVLVVVAYGGLFGLGARPIAVPVDAMALLGTDMEIVGFTPQQLDAFPAFRPGDATPLANGDIIRVGLARPSH